MSWAKSRPGGGKVNPKYRDPAHTKARNALIAAFTPGDPCCLCGHPMWHARYLEADHLPGTDTYRGLAHGVRHRCTTCGKRCNQSDASKRARARQSASRLRW